MTVVEDEFQSPPSPTIHYTYNDTLEGLGCCELHESVSAHTIWVPKVRMGQAKLYPLMSWKIGCDDQHFSSHIPISTMSNLSSYLSWREIGRVEMLWNGWISLYRLYLGMKCRGHAPNFSSPVTQKPRVWWRWWRMNSNLNLLQPFIILIMTHWKGWNAVNCLNQSAPTQSGFEK